MGIRRGLAILLTAWLGLSPVGTASAAAEGAADAVEITLDFQTVELVDMISTISELTGKNFVHEFASFISGTLSVRLRFGSKAEYVFTYHLFF